jgi:hypothetical protein
VDFAPKPENAILLCPAAIWREVPALNRAKMSASLWIDHQKGNHNEPARERLSRGENVASRGEIE